MVSNLFSSVVGTSSIPDQELRSCMPWSNSPCAVITGPAISGACTPQLECVCLNERSSMKQQRFCVPQLGSEDLTQSDKQVNK